MDEEIVRLVASAAAGVIVRAMGTAAWRATRERWSRVLGRGGDQEAVADQLDESARRLAAADPEHREDVASDLGSEWREALYDRLRTDADLVEPVRALVTGPSTEPRAGTVEQTSTVWSGTSIQSGRDTHLGEIPDG
jgi:hypothetical protein